VEAIDFQQDDDGVTVTLCHADGHGVGRARWLISCEGSGSMVRKNLVCRSRGGMKGRSSFRRTRESAGRTHRGGYTFNKKTLCGIFSVQRRRFYRILCADRTLIRQTTIHLH